MLTISDSLPSSRWTEALLFIQQALDILDETDAPGDIGSHLDLAFCRLEQELRECAGAQSPLCLQEEAARALADVRGEVPREVEVW